VSVCLTGAGGRFCRAGLSPRRPYVKKPATNYRRAALRSEFVEPRISARAILPPAGMAVVMVMRTMDEAGHQEIKVSRKKGDKANRCWTCARRSTSSSCRWWRTGRS